MGPGKGSFPRLSGALINKFFNPSTPSMRIVVVIDVLIVMVIGVVMVGVIVVVIGMVIVFVQWW